jgi:DNA-directed RNA polymerase beta' subunit
MAAELYKPSLSVKLIERGIVKNCKIKGKNNRQKKEPVVWDILENVIDILFY